MAEKAERGAWVEIHRIVLVSLGFRFAKAVRDFILLFLFSCHTACSSTDSQSARTSLQMSQSYGLETGSSAL